jgi:hypothetical protein
MRSCSLRSALASRCQQRFIDDAWTASDEQGTPIRLTVSIYPADPQLAGPG